MLPAEQTYRLQTIRLRNAYVAALKAERKNVDTWGAWARFASEMNATLHWAGALKASALRTRATHEVVAVNQLADREFDPEHQQLDLNRIIRDNPFLWDLNQATDERIRMLTAFIIEREKLYARQWVQSKRAKRDKELIPLHRLEMFYRQGVKEITTVSEQVQLADPEIDDKFPFAEYETKDDSRVRPTHAQMRGFVVCRWTEEGSRLLARISPPAGYGCRCALVYRNKFESIRRGWLGRNLVPAFDYKWPSSLARRNYDIGKFPDYGWGQERNKYIAMPRVYVKPKPRWRGIEAEIGALETELKVGRNDFVFPVASIS